MSMGKRAISVKKPVTYKQPFIPMKYVLNLATASENGDGGKSERTSSKSRMEPIVVHSPISFRQILDRGPRTPFKSNVLISSSLNGPFLKNPM